jgi:hypothetical protein
VVANASGVSYDHGVVGFAHTYGADARAVEATVVAGELCLDVVELLKIRHEQLLELGMRLVHRLARDGEDLLDVRALEALEHDTFTDHSGHTRQDDAHAPVYTSG